MLTTVLTFAVGFGFLGVTFIITKRAKQHYKNFQFLRSTTKRSVDELQDGEDVYVNGKLVVNEKADVPVEGHEDIGIASWALQRRDDDSDDQPKWNTRASGLVTGDIALRDEGDTVQIDTDWTVKKHSLENGLSATGPESSPYLYIDGKKNEEREGSKLKINDVPIDSGERFSEPVIEFIADKRPEQIQSRKHYMANIPRSRRRRFTLNHIEAGTDLTVMGEVTEAENGRLKIVGTDTSPLILANKTPEELVRSTQKEVILYAGVGVLALVIGIVAIGNGVTTLVGQSSVYGLV